MGDPPLHCLPAQTTASSTMTRKGSTKHSPHRSHKLGTFQTEAERLQTIKVHARTALGPQGRQLTSRAALVLVSKPSQTSTVRVSPTLRSSCTASACVRPSRLCWFTSSSRSPTRSRPSRPAAPVGLTYRENSVRPAPGTYPQSQEERALTLEIKMPSSVGSQGFPA